MKEAKRTGVGSISGVVEMVFALTGMAMQLLPVVVVTGETVQLLAKNGKEKYH